MRNVPHLERKGAGQSATHCQYVSTLSSRSCSTPFPGLAVESDQTAISPISRSSEDALDVAAALMLGVSAHGDGGKGGGAN